MTTDENPRCMTRFRDPAILNPGSCCADSCVEIRTEYDGRWALIAAHAHRRGRNAAAPNAGAHLSRPVLERPSAVTTATVCV